TAGSASGPDRTAAAPGDTGVAAPALLTGADPAGTPGPLGPVHLTGSYVPGPSGALPAGERRAPATGLEGEGP
ncbi:hypothetical protein ACFWF4_31555, partial [Nocardiopsis flavescens]